MVDATNDWWHVLLIVAAAGALGGVVADLALVRFGDSGLLERFSRQSPKESGGRSYYDVGFLGNMLVGAVAAIAFLYFLAPDVSTVVTDGGTTTTTREYDAIKLIAASLIVGTGGAAFLKAMSDRLLKLVEGAALSANLKAIEEQAQETEERLLSSAGGGPPAGDRTAEEGLVPLGEPPLTGELTGRLRAIQSLARHAVSG